MRPFAFPFTKLAWVAGAALVACGPSFQALYEGDARFEHCYALDESGVASMQQKSDCWRDWTLHYTYGQTRDRVEYAAARYRALTRAPQAPTDEAMMEAAPGEGRGLSIATPAPTSAFAPPPKTLAEVDGGPANGSAAAATMGAAPPPVGRAGAPTAAGPTRPPGADCGEGCRQAWGTCEDTCNGGAGGAGGAGGDAGRAAEGKGVCERCSTAYKACMKRCFAR